jgi:phage shock protein PspC (stress-responsive transcriptional regulator)
MKKTLSISLANLNFVLEEDAYQKLSTYLEQVRNFFSINPDKDEIVKDIEYSIADKFTLAISPTKQVITLEDTEKVMNEIGTTHDFKQTDATTAEQLTSDEETATEKKRLFRDEERKVIGGVCAGIAEYFEVDVVWIRALFGVLLFTPLFAVVSILYIILWLSTPPATNVVDKLKMQGEPVTLERIAAQIKDRVQQQDTPEKNIIKKIVSIPVIILTFVFKILKKVIPALFLAIACFAIIVVTGIILVVTYTVGIVLFFSNSPLVYFPLKDFPTTVPEYTLVLLGYLALILPLIEQVSNSQL